MRHRVTWRGGLPCLDFTGDWSNGVRINTGILECVCFLGLLANRDGQDEFEVAGTGFFVAVGDHRRAKSATFYLVTCKHIVVQGEGRGGLHARINRKDGGCEYVKLADLRAEWRKSETADVAAIMFALQGARDDDLDYALVHQDEFATDEWLTENYIEPSDEIAVTGLFISRKGTGKNVPVIRGGSIAALPDPSEPVTTTSKALSITAPAYLLEIHSSGGLSGSPVLVMTDPHRTTDGKILQRHEGTKLLGLIGAHWEWELPLEISRIAREQFTETNRGIAVGVPIQELTRLLSREDVVNERKDSRAKQRQKDAAVMDSILEEGTRGPEPERLIIDSSMDDAVKKMFEAGKPPRE
jgi:hypothetical protein